MLPLLLLLLLLLLLNVAEIPVSASMTVV